MRRVCVFYAQSLSLLLLIGCSILFAQTHDSKSVALLAGRDLKGWQGNKDYWRVEDGALVAEIRAGETLGSNEFLYWRDEVHDFELTLEYRVSGDASANSGIQF